MTFDEWVISSGRGHWGDSGVGSLRAAWEAADRAAREECARIADLWPGKGLEIKDFEQWLRETFGSAIHSVLYSRMREAWLESARRADRAARLECEDLALGLAGFDGTALQVADAIKATME